MSYYEELADSAAQRAINREGADKQTDAIGEGLDAIVLAILDLARAVRELAEAQQ
ncbi:hypothetical protein ACFU7Y_32090 [Kitasatospora sp. NPDC057542]|uniref:hypothetical protein n=1 Tax=Kitasatospora sp. NPDC057542 TaxID=3346162 RepID=UPI0036AE61C8